MCYGHGGRHRGGLCVVAAEVGKLVDGCHPACEPQSLRSSDLHASDAGSREDRLVHRRVWRGAAHRGGGVCDLLLATERGSGVERAGQYQEHGRRVKRAFSPQRHRETQK